MAGFEDNAEGQPEAGVRCYLLKFAERRSYARLFIQGRFSEGQKREPKSFMECISFFLFRFTALN